MEIDSHHGRRYRAAIVGLGKQACDTHIPAVSASQLADLVAVCDPDPAKLEHIAADLSVPGYLDHVQMLESEQLDFVIVAAPHHAHNLIVADAAARSVNVIKEKPLALCAAEARELVAMAADHQVEIMVATQRRFSPIYTSFFHMIEPIGQPFFVDARYTMYIAEPHVGWRGSKSEAGGGCIIDMGYHMLDLLTWYFGLPVSVSATLSARAIEDHYYDAEDTASILMSWPTGMHGSCLVSRRIPPKTELLRVIGPAGIVELTPGSIRRLTCDGEVAENLQHSQPSGLPATTHINHFCRVLSGECENISGAASHLPNVTLIDACYESASKQIAVDLPEEVNV